MAMRPLLLLLCVSLSGCMHGCGGDAGDGDHEGHPAAEASSAGAEGAVEAAGAEASEDYAEPPPIEPPD